MNNFSSCFKPPEAKVADVENGHASLPRRLSRKVSLITKIPMYDMTAVLVCYATRFVDMFVRSQLETLGSSFAMNMFSLNEKDAVRYVSMAQGTVGFLTLFVYIGYICLDLERWSVTF